MATKDDRPNLLSKVALFVRNPTKDWSELDNPESMLQSGYDRGALKAAIERKRQNDFVRKREFDQLRKLRKSAANGEVAQVRPSVFQSSTVTDPDARALTLRKIDEIEAQMSKQWWKGKGEGAPAPAAAVPSPVSSEESETGMPSSTQSPVTNFPATEPMPAEKAPAAEFAATQVSASMGTVPAPLAGARKSASTQPGDAAELAFSTSQLFASDAQDMTTDPELEEASIRFANSDDAGAEAVLLQAMRSEPGVAEVAMSWLAALLDLYRATGNRNGFDQAVVEFSWRFPSMAPQWSDFRESGNTSAPAPAVPSAADVAPPRQAPGMALWRCPTQLDHTAMELLRDVLSGSPMPWRLDWSTLQSVSADALPLLSALFSSLCAEPVSVEFCGGTVVADVLRALTPSSDRTVPHERWVLRLDALRVMQRIDDFELAALDYCVTFEVAPPPWMPANCQYAEFEAPAAGQGTDTTVTLPLNTVPLRFDGAATPDGHLAGTLSGDAGAALAALEPVVGSGRNVLVSCAGLLRVDFAAAGSILNWVAVQQNGGCAIQFVDVHRLVAAFFNVIGINEHARVTPRNI